VEVEMEMAGRHRLASLPYFFLFGFTQHGRRKNTPLAPIFTRQVTPLATFS